MKDGEGDKKRKKGSEGEGGRLADMSIGRFVGRYTNRQTGSYWFLLHPVDWDDKRNR